MELQELKNRINIDIEGSLTRFANMEKMYIKFLKKFREDETFEKLSKAVEEKDRRETEQAAQIWDLRICALCSTRSYRRSGQGKPSGSRLFMKKQRRIWKERQKLSDFWIDRKGFENGGVQVNGKKFRGGRKIDHADR